MNYIFDDKKEWYEFRKQVYLEILKSSVIDFNIKRFIQQHKDQVIYETPKTFVDGVAHNDGSWVIYNTIKCNKSKKPVWNIKIKNYEHIIKTIYGYISFLKVAGFNDKNSLLYFTLTFFDRITFYMGIFECNDNNKKRLKQLIDFVNKKNIDELTKGWTRNKPERIGCWDDRKFSIKTDGLNTSEKTKLQHKVMNKKEHTDELIKKFYDPNKTIKQNLETLKENGVKCGKARLCNWMKEYKEQAVQNDPVTLLNEEVNEEVKAVQNDPVTCDDRLSKMDHNYLNKLNRIPFDWHQRCQEEKDMIEEKNKEKEDQIRENKKKGIYDVIGKEENNTTGYLSYEIDEIFRLCSSL